MICNDMAAGFNPIRFSMAFLSRDTRVVEMAHRQMTVKANHFRAAIYQATTLQRTRQPAAS